MRRHSAAGALAAPVSAGMPFRLCKHARTMPRVKARSGRAGFKQADGDLLQPRPSDPGRAGQRHVPYTVQRAAEAAFSHCRNARSSPASLELQPCHSNDGFECRDVLPALRNSGRARAKPLSRVIPVCAAHSLQTGFPDGTDAALYSPHTKKGKKQYLTRLECEPQDFA